MSFKGQANIYRCDECAGLTVTIDRDDGVTPMFLACRASGEAGTCEGRAVSQGYPPIVLEKPEWEWYMPSEKEMVGLDMEIFHHVRRGGLLLRRIEP